MSLAIAGVILTALTIFSVWWAAGRIWQIPLILVIAVPLFPFAATRFAGDVSRYLPAGTFSEGADGKDQIVLASAAASILIAVILASCIWGAAKIGWRRIRAYWK